MIKTLIKAIKFPSTAQRLLSISTFELGISQYFRKNYKKTKSATDIILVQTVEDVYFFALFGLVTSSLAANKPIRIEQLIFHSVRVGESEGLVKFIGSRLVNRMLCKKWGGLYSAFCDGIAYRCTGLGSPFSDGFDFCRAYTIWRSIKNKDNLTALVVDDIRIGDLVNDTFLRFKPAPTVELKDIFLFIVIWQALRDLRRSTEYFKRVKPKVFLTSYTTYIQHGIAARVALKNGVSVFSFSNPHEFAKKLSLDDCLHSRNSVSYARDVSQLNDLENKLHLADKAMAARISGVIDTATSYMKHSAYADSKEPVPNVDGAVVIFLHDFYDSPHVYANMIFPDFWEWVCFTIEKLRDADINFYIKPHPNQIELSDAVLIALKKRYPFVKVISSKNSNRQLVEAGMACAVTVYGTVAHEMAYMGVPTIASANHPHISFDFCKTAKSRHEYADLLKNANHLDFNPHEMKLQCLIFYVMHNLNLDEGEKSIIDAFANLRQHYVDTGIVDVKFRIQMLQEIKEMSSFEAYVAKVIGMTV